MSNSICVPHKLFNPITEVSIFASALCNPFTTMYFGLFSFSQLIWTVNITQMFRRHTALRFVLHTLQFSHLSVLRNPHFGVLQIYLSLPNSLCSDFSLLCWIDFNTHSQISHCCSKPGSTWFVINLFLPQSRSPKHNGVWLVLTCATFLQSHAGSKNSEV